MEKSFGELTVGDSIYDVYWYDEDSAPTITECCVIDVDEETNVLTYKVTFPGGDQTDVKVNTTGENETETKILRNSQFAIATSIEAAMLCKSDIVSKKNKKKRKR